VIALDASVLIGYLDATDAHHARAQEALLAHAGEPFCASVVTLAEVLVGATRAGESAKVRTALANVSVDPVPLAAGAEMVLAEIRATSRLRLPDCCVLLSARERSAAVLTFDDRLRVAAAELQLAVVDA
jgi:predicted nucleic acid-binding protein